MHFIFFIQSRYNVSSESEYLDSSRRSSALSVASREALDKLFKFELALEDIEAVVLGEDDDDVSRGSFEELAGRKARLAAAYGKAEKLQSNDIDAVLVSALSTGKEEAQGKRKDLANRVQSALQSIDAAHKKVDEALSSIKSKGSLEEDFSDRLIAFYEKFNPVKISSMGDILKKYKGREEVLFGKLHRQYKVEKVEDYFPRRASTLSVGEANETKTNSPPPLMSRIKASESSPSSDKSSPYSPRRPPKLTQFEAFTPPPPGMTTPIKKQKKSPTKKRSSPSKYVPTYKIPQEPPPPLPSSPPSYNRFSLKVDGTAGDGDNGDEQQQGAIPIARSPSAQSTGGDTVLSLN